MPPPRPAPFSLVDEIARHCAQEAEPETVHVEVHLPGRVDRPRLRAAFGRALARHPRALLRQAPVRWWHPRYVWEPAGSPDTAPVSFSGRDPGSLRRAREQALAECPRLDAGPPVRLAVTEQATRTGTGNTGTGTVLLLTAHHTALDAPSCLRLLATTAELYGGAANSPAPPPVRAPEPTVRRARRNGASPVSTALRRPARIAADRAGATPGNGMLLTQLPVPARPPRAPEAAGPAHTVNDQLLLAVFLMVTRWNHLHRTRAAPVVLTMPVDDRPRGTGMPLGNGTRLVPVCFGPADLRDAAPAAASGPPGPAAIARLLRRTAARTRALKATPGRPLGLAGAVLTAPVLPVGVRAAVTRRARAAAAPWTSTALLSNIGRVPYPFDFGDGGRATGVWFSAPARMPRGLSLATVSTGDRIQLTLRWSRALLDDAAGGALCALFEESLAATSWSGA
ncbi:condensation protein [Streptomyces purpurogeneiscleroticus]|uniref:condensation protein n=1 Tax=Streptomyces purpurogeneiscleroticus TaxID=68259 RepID=UPI001CC112A1|nr:condensation protein [Streptomyces purpurogeneiscleroticus]MBZ4019155.1 condensation protein [Streptomyces purpurogeneiscleroticus]